MRTDKQWLIAFISHFTPTKSILTVAVMILEYVLNPANLIFFCLLEEKEHHSWRLTVRMCVCVCLFFCFFFKSSNGLFAAHQGVFCFKKCISYLCFPSSQLASICCRLGLANSSAMSRRLEKLAANKSPNPSCFPCLEWWTTLPLIYEMIWEVCVCVCVRVCMSVCVCVSVKWRKCAWERRHVLVSVLYIGYLFLCAGMLWCEC